MRESIFYVNGEFVPAREAVLPATDLAVLRALAVFDSFRTYRGKPFHLDAHLARLQRSAELIGLTLPWSREELSQVVQATLEKNGFPESSIRIIVTGGQSEDFMTPSGTPSLLVIVKPYLPAPSAYYEVGVKVATAEIGRNLPEAKTINYIAGQIALRKARVRDPEIVEVLYVDTNRNVTEGIVSNVFAFLGDALVTPGESILLGITRQVVLELAAPIFNVEERDIPLSEFYAADEVFLTGSNKEIVPVRAIDDVAVGAGKPGPHTQKLMAVFREMAVRFANEQ